MWVASDPEYADVNDRINALLTPNVLTYLAQGKAFVGEAYPRETSRSPKLESATIDETGPNAQNSQSDAHR